MAAKKGGLGRGLDALFADNSIEEIASTSAVKLKIMDIEPNRDQPRKIFDEDALAELADSIAKHGVIQPLLVRPMPDGSYQLVAGGSDRSPRCYKRAQRRRGDGSRSYRKPPARGSQRD